MVEYGIAAGAAAGGGGGYSGPGAWDRLEALGADPSTLALAAGIVLVLILVLRRT